MTIIARYPGRCKKCGGRISPDDRIDWDKNTRETSHVNCPERKPEQPQEKGSIRIAGGSGYGCRGWSVGQVVRNTPRNIEAGGPEWLYVVSAKKEWVSEDGMSFGVGDESGYIYTAFCRPATEEEAAPVIAARKAAEEKQAAKRAALADLDAIKAHITENGDRPSEWEKGETVNIGQGHTIYGGGEWFLITESRIWYCRGNGGDGDDWSDNNLPGVRAWRVPRTEELADRIRKATEYTR